MPTTPQEPEEPRNDQEQVEEVPMDIEGMGPGEEGEEENRGPEGGPEPTHGP